MELSATVAARIGRLRRDREWSLSSLASRAGIGKATLSEIEAGRRNPTLETLYAVAGALDVPLVQLISAPSERRAGEHPRVEGAAVVATLLESWEDPGMTTELYRLAIRPGARQVSPAHGAGVTEHLTVVSGRVLVGPVGAPIEAGAGDHVSWSGATDHVYEARSAGEAEAVLVIRHPN
jgi:transcriptional regulator with XRE-family HTH domain